MQSQFCPKCLKSEIRGQFTVFYKLPLFISHFPVPSIRTEAQFSHPELFVNFSFSPKTWPMRNRPKRRIFSYRYFSSRYFPKFLKNAILTKFEMRQLFRLPRKQSSNEFYCWQKIISQNPVIV